MLPFKVLKNSPVIKAGIYSFSVIAEDNPRLDKGIVSTKYTKNQTNCIPAIFLALLPAYFITVLIEKCVPFCFPYTIKVITENSTKVKKAIQSK